MVVSVFNDKKLDIDMKPTIIFVSSKSWVSKAIQFITGGNVTHAIIGGFTIESADIVMHSATSGVAFLPREKALVGCDIVGEFAISHDVNIKQLLNDLGQPYDYLEMLGYVWVYLGKLIKQRWHNPLGSSQSFVCVELIMSMNLPELNQLDKHATSPQDLYNACSLCYDRIK
jgi:hypothetical protein